MLCNNYSDEIELDEIELEEHDYSLLQSVIENLQSYLFKARKVNPFLLFLSKSCELISSGFCQLEIHSVDHVHNVHPSVFLSCFSSLFILK